MRVLYCIHSAMLDEKRAAPSGFLQTHAVIFDEGKKLSNNTFHELCSHCSTAHDCFYFTHAGDVLEKDLLQSNPIHPHVLKF